jgi:hypothetical protein
MQRNLSFLACLGFASLGLMGCANPSPQEGNAPVTSTKSVNDTGLPAGWTKVEVQGEKMSIACLPNWVAIDPSAKDFEKMMETANLSADMMAEIKQATANKSIKLLVFKKVQAGTFSPNLNIIETKIPADVTLQQLQDLNVSQLKGIAVGTPTVTNTTLAGTDARCVKWVQKNPSGVGPSTLQETTYLLIKNGNQYVLTFTLTDSSEDAGVEAMAKTFSLG